MQDNLKFMEKMYELIGPGTAGIAQRISSVHEAEEYDASSKVEEDGLYVLKRNSLMPCSQNQY